jgi:hypothetical protein
MGVSTGEPPPERGGAYTYVGSIAFQYAPERDREPDPGEIVWTWVSFEENAHLGKDRPVAIVGRTADGRYASLMLSSQDHQGDRGWVSIGAGPWDREGRVSWLRTDRVLAVHGEAVRREGAIMTREVYDRVVLAMGGGAPVKRTRFTRIRRLFGRT